MRWLNVTNTLDPREGGTVEAILQLRRELQRRNHSVHVLTGDAPGSATEESIHCLGPGFGRFCYLPHLAAWLRHNVNKYDVVLLHGIWQYPTLCARYEAARAGVTHFICGHGMMEFGGRRDSPLKHLKKKLYWSIVGRNMLRTSHVLFATADERYRANALLRGFNVIAVIATQGIARPEVPDEASVQAFRHRMKLEGQRVALFLGRIHERKGISRLLRSFAATCCNVPDTKLLVAGTGNDHYCRQMRRLAQELRIDTRITWSGFLSRDDISCAFASADVFVLPSEGDSFGMSVARSLAFGVPVIISNQVGTWHSVHDLGAGWVCEPTDGDLARCLLQWIQADSTELERLSMAARACFEANFTVARAVDELIQAVQLTQAQVGIAVTNLAITHDPFDASAG
jgi:glycosyltransferase involved in cell wall biosynthesis